MNSYFMKVVLSLVSLIISAKLKLDVYTESDCPGCMEFYVSQLSKVVSNPDLLALTDISVTSYGNAQTDGSTVTCQHGDNECVGNKWQNCGQKYLNDQDASNKFIVCTETANQKLAPNGNWEKTVSSCLSDDDLLAKVKTCATGSEGNDLLVAAGKRTPKDHQYVPWLVINGKHTEDSENAALNDLVKLICDQNKGAKGCSTEVNFRLNGLGIWDSIEASVVDYDKPPCDDTNEIAVEIQGVSGSVCTPKCNNKQCNYPTPSGCTAKQMCALQSPQGDQYCVLICSGFASGTCPSGASCKTVSGVGICTYD